MDFQGELKVKNEKDHINNLIAIIPHKTINIKADKYNPLSINFYSDNLYVKANPFYYTWYPLNSLVLPIHFFYLGIKSKSFTAVWSSSKSIFSLVYQWRFSAVPGAYIHVVILW